MLYNKFILLLNDNSQDLQRVQHALTFVNEQYLVDSLGSADIAAHVKSEVNPVGLVLAYAADTESLEALFKQVVDLEAYLPVVVIENTEQPTSLSTDIERHIVEVLPSDFNFVQLNAVLNKAQRIVEHHERHPNSKDTRPNHLFRSLVGTSREIKNVRGMMSRVTDKDVTVLIQGESGTGKEVVARNLHYHSPRKDGPFVPVNCGAIPEELLESELFGHEKGAFTGAISARAGRFELAEGGTLFLDEIGDMPLHMQVKILRVLQERTYERVGGNKSFKTDVRIIAATHRNLDTMIEKGDFREDLYYRLNVFPIEMPALRERSEDIPLLVQELVTRLESEKRGSVRFNSAAVMSLCNHPWPGNVRELANLVERMAIMHPYGVVGARDLPGKYQHVELEEEPSMELETVDAKPALISSGDTMLLPEEGIDLREFISGLEQNLIQQALDNAGGVVARAADQLAIRRTTLVEKMKKIRHAAWLITLSICRQKKSFLVFIQYNLLIYI